MIIKSTGDSLEFWLDDQRPYPELIETLKNRLNENASFYTGATQKIVFYGKHFTNFQKREIKNFLSSNYELADVNFVDDEEPEKQQEPVKQKINKVKKTEPFKQKDAAFSKPADSSARESLFITNTIRSGQRIECTGDIVIVGDVNAGAEIIADGSIAVFGRLRGVVHAGASGDKNAIIVANYLLPSQIRICGKIALMPQNRQITGTETVKLIEDKIVIAPMT